MEKTTSSEALARRIYVFHFNLFDDEDLLASDCAPVRFTARELEAIAEQYGRTSMAWPRSARRKVEDAIERQARVITEDDDYVLDADFVRWEEMPWELGWACRRLRGLPEPEEDDVYSAAQEGDEGGRVLTVRVAADTLERVRAGRQRELRLDVTPYSRGWLVDCDEDGETLRDDAGHCLPAEYEAVRLLAPDGQSLVCRFTAQGHTPRHAMPRPEGEPLELPEMYEQDDTLCVREEVIYTLGEVITD